MDDWTVGPVPEEKSLLYYSTEADYCRFCSNGFSWFSCLWSKHVGFLLATADSRTYFWNLQQLHVSPYQRLRLYRTLIGAYVRTWPDANWKAFFNKTAVAWSSWGRFEGEAAIGSIRNNRNWFFIPLSVGCALLQSIGLSWVESVTKAAGQCTHWSCPDKRLIYDLMRSNPLRTWWNQFPSSLLN